MKDGGQLLTAGGFDVVLLDVHLPDGNGLLAIPKILANDDPPVIIIITGLGDPDGAELAITSGAWDYIEKPLTKSSIRLPLERAIQFREEKKKLLPIALKREGIIGNSAIMQNCLDILARASTCTEPVLITGETGTGKELFAQAIHQNSNRGRKNFVVVDCAALPENLVESTLFGHRKGAFTGADKDTDGLVKMANGGTLFLDEIGELPLTVQGSFLRVLQEHSFRPIGDRRELTSNFRLLAATNRDLEYLGQTENFRQDLLYRLRSIILELPPLRKRREDIKILAIHFMTRYCERHELNIKGFSPTFLDLLLNSSYGWPGNIRELANVVTSSVNAAGAAPVLFPDHFPLYFRAQLAREAVGGKDKPASARPKDSSPEVFQSLRASREAAIMETESSYLRNLMNHTAWNIKEACRLAVLSRPRLYSLLKKYHITRQ
jgi:two-component system NtrC family response regulator